jgi:3-isopropylmalate dehydrogenase
MAARIEAAVEQILAQGYRTRDIQSPGTKPVGTAEMGALVLEALGR